VSEKYNNLVIVESPAKAKTIEKFLGRDFKVKSSVGHVRSLPSREGSIDVENDFAPTYEIEPDKKKIINELKKAVAESDTVWLASDEDREGEAIAWHLSEVLGLDPATTKRIVFHEITREALDAAIKNPRAIDLQLVAAQRARQALDYLVGFELSPVLWKKVAPKLSAGRVQSVAVRLIVEREAEITAHVPQSSFKLSADFVLSDGSKLPAICPRTLTNIAEVREILQSYIGATFRIANIEKKDGTRNPSPPFTTSTLQQAASNRLGFSPRTTMQLAQRLYEAGHITYMRTDSLNLSGQALGAMTEYVTGKFGAKYHQIRTFKAKTSGAQEAHEAIRPTDFTKEFAGADERQQRLYNLIWRRTLASQMASAKIEKTVVTIEPNSTIGNTPDKAALEAKGEVVVFDGYLRVMGRSSDDVLLPPLAIDDELALERAEAIEQLSRGPARYTEASLVKKLEEMGIGRPSTYATTLGTIETRGYVERGDVDGVEKPVQHLLLQNAQITETTDTIEYGKDRGKLLPTDRGKVVTDFLVKYFAAIIDYDFTKQMEERLDAVASGQRGRVDILRDFYDLFHPLIEKSNSVSRAEANQARLIGHDPNDNQPIYARFGRFGPMLQKGEQSDDPKPKFAPMPSGAGLDTVTLGQALAMFKLPRVVGTTEDDQEITAGIGRFGPYIKVGTTFVSIKPLDPTTIDEAKARELYVDKMAAEAAKNIADFGGGLKVLNGRYGPYVTDGTKNAKVPRDIDPLAITAERAQEILDVTPVRKRRYVRRSK
jgi:DNA topoisomerase-1